MAKTGAQFASRLKCTALSQDRLPRPPNDGPRIVDLDLSGYGLESAWLHDQLAGLAGSVSQATARFWRHGSLTSHAPMEAATLGDLLSDAASEKVTIGIDHTQNYVPSMARLAIDLTSFFKAKVGIHLFITAPLLHSTPVHYDYHDILVYQMLGTKKWEFFRLPEDPTFTNEGSRVDVARLGAPCFECTLSQGECLFFPKGVPHRVSATKDESVHLSIGVHPITSLDLLRALVPEMPDSVGWSGRPFESLVQELSTLILKQAGSRSLAAVSAMADNVLWDELYRLQRVARKAIEEPGQFECGVERMVARHKIGRPFSWLDLDDGLIVNYLDVEDAARKMDGYGFAPAQITLPSVARPFINELSTGLVDQKRLLKTYDSATVDVLMDVFSNIGIIAPADTRVVGEVALHG